MEPSVALRADSPPVNRPFLPLSDTITSNEDAAKIESDKLFQIEKLKRLSDK